MTNLHKIVSARGKALDENINGKTPGRHKIHEC